MPHAYILRRLSKGSKGKRQPRNFLRLRRNCLRSNEINEFLVPIAYLHVLMSLSSTTVDSSSTTCMFPCKTDTTTPNFPASPSVKVPNPSTSSTSPSPLGGQTRFNPQ